MSAYNGKNVQAFKTIVTMSPLGFLSHYRNMYNDLSTCTTRARQLEIGQSCKTYQQIKIKAFLDITPPTFQL